MGNAASIEPYGTMTPGSENYMISIEPEPDSVAAEAVPAPLPEAVPPPKKVVRRQSSVEKDDPEEEVDAVELLFQFIPYYGQGDASNDSIVRSTLSSLSVEDIDKVDAYGNTLLLLACQYRCEPLVRIILNKGADPNALNSAGASCLHFACYKESMSKNIAKLLLQNGANPEISETTFGCTPLHYCASTGDVDFCKMLLSYGAHVGTYDYYQYTCVDYAREAGMREAAVFLQKKMLMTASQGPGGFAAGKADGGGLFFGKNDLSVSGLQGNASFRMSPTKQVSCSIMDTRDEEWVSNIDPTSGAKYYLNTTNGECLWEADYLKRVTASSGTGGGDLLGGLKREESVHQFGAGDVDLLGGMPSGGKSIRRTESGNSMPGLIKSQLSSRRLNTDSLTTSDASVKKLLSEAKMQAEADLEKERNDHRAAVAEKDGKIAKLTTEVSMLIREKERAEGDINDLKKKLEVAQMSGGEAAKETQDMMSKLEAECSTLKSSLSQTESALAREQEKLKSLEATLNNLESGQSESVAQAQRAAEERAKQNEAMEAKHRAELGAVETKLSDTKSKLQLEISNLKDQLAVMARNADNRMEEYRRERDKEVDELNRGIAEKSANFAEELSNAQSIAENYKKKNADAEERAEAAEQAQAVMMQEIEEARAVQQFNAQLHRDLQREQQARKKLHNEIEDMKGKIRVYVRVRPFSNSEKQKGCTEAVIKDGKMTVMVKGAKGPDSKKSFDFDQVFGGASNEGNSQVDVFKDTKHLMLSVIDGYNVCIFAYGQTGSGKTFTMIGAADIGTCLRENGEFDELAGITPRAVSEIFRLLNERTAQCSFEVNVQMFQLYRDGLEDLLHEKKGGDTKSGNLKITLAEHSPTGLVHVEGANSITATTAAEVMKIFELGASRRTTASTQMNAESSRSHLICSLVITLTNRRTGTTTTGKLTVVDLAGSERVDKSGAMGEMLKEAQSINKSLSALGDVIAALTTSSSHVPYRNHPLTMLMSDSIGGNAKTLMFVNCSPADYNVAESNSSLSFAARCKDVTNSGAAPPAQQVAQLNALKKELAKLKKGNGAAAGGGAKLARPV